MNQTHSPSRDSDYLFKVRIDGAPRVGKTALNERYLDGNFSNGDPRMTFIADFRIKTVNFDDKTIKLQLWDRSGAEKYGPITGFHYRGCCGVLLVYDVTNRSTFEAIENYIPKIQQYATESCITVLCGNKMDLKQERIVSFDEGAQFAEKLGMPFFEISAKTGSGVYEAFDKLISLMIKTGNGKIEKKEPKDATNIQGLQKDYCTENKKNSCL